jgi:Cd2+/Zn2+-exporting ATPase
MEESEEAAAILEAYGQKPDRSVIALGNTLPGLGTLVHTKGLVISAGNERMMERLGLGEQAAQNGGEDAVHIAVQERYAGSILLRRIQFHAENDPVPSVALLGLNRLVLLSCGQDAAAEPGVDEVLRVADAEEKSMAMERLLAATFPDETLLYYGPDPAMQKQADVGVAPPEAERAGSAFLAEERADTLARTILLGKKAKSFAWQALVAVLALKLLLLIAFLAGFLPLWPVVLADCGLALLAALNALRLKGRR